MPRSGPAPAGAGAGAAPAEDGRPGRAGWDRLSQAEFGPDPGGHPADGVVGLGRPSGGHLEGVLLLGEDVGADLHAGRAGVGGGHPAAGGHWGRAWAELGRAWADSAECTRAAKWRHVSYTEHATRVG